MRFLLLLLIMATVSVAHAEISVSDAWVRATPPGAQTAAVYLTLHNNGADDDLLDASTNVATEAQLHTHRHEQGMMRMEQVASFALPSGVTIFLEPGGNHLMLMNINHPMQPGEIVEIELFFHLSEPLKLRVPVRDGRVQ